MKRTSSPLSCDIFILGGGSAGAAAAWAASAPGLSVVLAEKTGRLGGTATNGLVSTLCGCYSSAGERRKIVGGVRDVLMEELHALGGLEEGVNRDTHRSDICDPELLVCALDKMMLKKGVTLHLSTLVTEVSIDNGRVVSLHAVNGESGTVFHITPRMVVDATGRAFLSPPASSGDNSSETGRKLQAGTLVFRMDNVDGNRARAVTKEQITDLLAEARAKGDVTQERGNGVLTVLPCNSAAIVNANWVKADMTMPEDVTRGLVEGRKKVVENALFFQKYVPGFERAVLSVIAPALGVRETTRIDGEYTLTEGDISVGRRFSDGVCLGGWPMEYHDYERNCLVYAWNDREYSIPYRSMIPRELDNVLAAGRNISVTPMTYASTRVMGPCLALGQAAGTALRLCVQRGCLPRELDTNLLRKVLREEGAILE